MDSQNGAKLVAVDEDPQLPGEAVSEPHVEGERGQCPAGLPRGVSDPQRLISPAGFRQNNFANPYHRDQSNRKSPYFV